MSQYLWPRYDCHFVGITWHNVWSSEVKIYRVIYIKFNPLVYESVRMITNLPTRAYLGDITVANISQSFAHKTAKKTFSRHRYGSNLRHCHPPKTPGMPKYTPKVPLSVGRSWTSWPSWFLVHIPNGMRIG